MKSAKLLLLALFALPTLVFGQNIGTLDQFTSTTTPSSAITQRTWGKTIKITGLSTGTCLSLDGNSLLTTIACGGASATFPFDRQTWGVSTTTTIGLFNGFLSTASSTLTNFFFSNATGTSATTTNFFSTTASSTNLYSTLFYGGALTTCNGASNALIWSAGSFGCNSISASGGGGSGNVATSSAETSGRVPFWTSTAATPATLSGGVAGFTFDSTANKLTATNLQATSATATGATTTSFAISGIASALLKTSAGGSVIPAVLGTDYINSTEQNYKEAVKYSSTGVLPTVVYANGSSGVGATLTGFSVGALSLDSSSPSVNDRVLIKNQADLTQNGIYKVTATGSGIAVFIMTRATDFDEPGEIMTGDTVFTTSGSTQSATTWAYTGIDSPTIGTNDITFVQIAGQGSFTAGNGISISGTTISQDFTYNGTYTGNLILNSITRSTTTQATTTNLFANTLNFVTGSTTNLTAMGSTTLQNFTFRNATGTSATTTNLFSTTASSTNLYTSFLTVDGTTLYANGITNRVGIGTTTPNSALEVMMNSSGATIAGLTLSNQQSATSSGVRLQFQGLQFDKQATTTAVIDAILGKNFATGTSTLQFRTLNAGALTLQGGFTDTGLQMVGSSTLQNFTGVNATTSQATTTNFATTNVTSSLVLTSSLGSFIPYSSQTCTNQFARSWTAAGTVTCATVGASDVSLANLTATDSTLTFSGTYNGATARTIGINLATSNIWTASTTFPNISFTLSTSTNATTTNFSTTNASTTNLYVGSAGGGVAGCAQFSAIGFISSTGSACASASTPNSKWATTTIANSQGLYPSGGAITDVLIGATATTSKAKLEVIQGAAANGSLLVNGSSTLQNFTGLKATTTSATSTDFAITNLASTFLAANANGSVIATSSPILKYSTSTDLMTGTSTSPTLTSDASYKLTTVNFQIGSTSPNTTWRLSFNNLLNTVFFGTLVSGATQAVSAPSANLAVVTPGINVAGGPMTLDFTISSSTKYKIITFRSTQMNPGNGNSDYYNGIFYYATTVPITSFQISPANNAASEASTTMTIFQQ